MKHFLKQLRSNWIILAFIGSSIYTFSTMQGKVLAQEKAQACTVLDVSELRKSCTDSNKDIAVIKNDIATIKESNKEQKEDIKKILLMVSRSR